MKNKTDIYAQLTNKMVAAIEKHQGEKVVCPWHRNSTTPRNVATGNIYRGINIVSLWATACERDYDTALWGTYRQWKAVGAQVEKGETGAVIVCYKPYEKEVELDSGDTEILRGAYCMSSVVFNEAQVSGFTSQPVEREDSFQHIDDIDDFVYNTDADIEHVGQEACYIPSRDKILMPPPDLFKTIGNSTAQESYYAVLLHELSHWTGAQHRLNRSLTNRFGDDAYAMEELVADLASAMLCAELGIASEPRPDHARYLASWLSVLKGDKKAIFSAAAKASQALEYLKSLQPEQDQCPDENQAA